MHCINLTAVGWINPTMSELVVTVAEKPRWKNLKKKIKNNKPNTSCHDTIPFGYMNKDGADIQIIFIYASPNYRYTRRLKPLGYCFL